MREKKIKDGYIYIREMTYSSVEYFVVESYKFKSRLYLYKSSMSNIILMFDVLSIFLIYIYAIHVFRIAFILYGHFRFEFSFSYTWRPIT